MVHTMMGRDCRPVWRTTVRSRPKPSRITAHWRIFLEVNLIPGAILPWSFRGTAMSIPRRMAITGPPTHGEEGPQKPGGDGDGQAQQQSPAVFSQETS